MKYIMSVWKQKQKSVCVFDVCGCMDLFHYHTMPCYSMYAHTHAWQTWAPLVAGKIWCRTHSCGQAWTYHGNKENQGDVCRQTSASKCMCVQAPAFLHSVRREEKYRFFICPGGSSSTVSTFAWSKKKSNCYLKHRPANNKGLIQPQWYLYFLVK